jgi:hypothetical protein
VRIVKAVAEEVVGLFVGDWTQTLTSVAILGVGWLALPRVHIAGVAFVIAAALAAQLIFATTLEARRMVRGGSRSPR